LTSPKKSVLLLILLTACLFLTLTACGGAPPALFPLGEDAVVLAFGNSLTFGTGADENESYPARLEQMIGRTVINSGVPGEVTGQGLTRLPEVLEEHQPALMILCHGGNDMLRKMDKRKAAANIGAMIQTAKDRGVDVILIGVPKPGLFPSSADFYGDIAKEFNIPYEEKALTDILSDGSLKSDPIHPNADGYNELARAIADLLRGAKAL
jgi:lysophospholipase L1-like esterase